MASKILKLKRPSVRDIGSSETEKRLFLYMLLFLGTLNCTFCVDSVDCVCIGIGEFLNNRNLLTLKMMR